MNSRLAKIGEWLGSAAPGGVVHTDSGVTLHVSSNGTTSVPASSLEAIVFKRFEEMHAAKPATAAAVATVVSPAVVADK